MTNIWEKKIGFSFLQTPFNGVDVLILLMMVKIENPFTFHMQSCAKKWNSFHLKLCKGDKKYQLVTCSINALNSIQFLIQTNEQISEKAVKWKLEWHFFDSEKYDAN